MRYLLKLWHWLRTPVADRVSDEWLLDNRRAELKVGVEQSTSLWPWPVDGRW